MEVVAFMQNPWFKSRISPHHVERYTHNQDFHRRVLVGSMSGRRLQRAFGENFDKIWWDNANPEPVYGNSSGKQPPNIYHMIAVICRIAPRIVITIGNEAYSGMQTIAKMEHEIRMPDYVRMHVHHPNARGKTQQDLDDFAVDVMNKIGELHERELTRKS